MPTVRSLRIQSDIELKRTAKFDSTDIYTLNAATTCSSREKKLMGTYAFYGNIFKYLFYNRLVV